MRSLRWPKLGAWLPLIALAALTAASAANAADPREAGPRVLIITYHTTPAHRATFRHELEESAAQWRRWKEEGVLQDYRVVYNRYVDSANWDALALLSFAGDAGVERWKRVEIDSPAGLSPKAFRFLCPSLNRMHLDRPARETLFYDPADYIRDWDEFVSAVGKISR